MNHEDFERLTQMGMSTEQKIKLRDDYIKYLEYKVSKLEGRIEILLQILKDSK